MKVVWFKIAQKIPDFLGYLINQNFYKEVIKIAQSGHTEGEASLYSWSPGADVIKLLFLA